jgi:N-acetyl-anhydromuramyl-L-alanine amidase AmpD
VASVDDNYNYPTNNSSEEQEEDFEEKRSQLEERVSVIEQGLNRCGIKSAELKTEEVIEVFYKVFNPGDVEGKIKLAE